jgi:ornithine--oxo-acid transaminase
VKDTHESTIRLAPPLVVERDDLSWALGRIVPTLASVRQ